MILQTARFRLALPTTQLPGGSGAQVTAAKEGKGGTTELASDICKVGEVR